MAFNMQSYSPSVQLGSAAVSAGGGLLSSIVGAIANSNAASTQYKRQKDLMALQNDYAVENWKMENEYDLPSKQIARLREAGINPNSTLGSGVQNTASELGAPSVGTPSVPDIGTPLTSGIQSIIPGILSLEQANETNARAYGQDIQNRYMPKQLDEAIMKLKSERQLNSQQAVKVQEEISVMQEKTPAEVKMIYAQASLAAQNIKESRSRQGLVEEQTKGASFDNSVKEVIGNLAKQGIVVSGDGMTTLITALLSPNSADLVREAINNLLYGMMPSFVKGVNDFNPLRGQRRSGVR